MKKNQFLFFVAMFLYFGLKDISKFNIIYNGIPIILSIICLIAWIFYDKIFKK